MRFNRIYFKHVCCKTSRKTKLGSVKGTPRTKCWIWKHSFQFYMNLSTQPLGHCFSAFYHVGMPTPWVQHAALTSTAPEGQSGVKQSNLASRGESSWPGWRDQKGWKLTVWSLWGRRAAHSHSRRAPGHDKGLSTASMILWRKLRAVVCQIWGY